jgi:hypothetical protein
MSLKTPLLQRQWLTREEGLMAFATFSLITVPARR